MPSAEARDSWGPGAHSRSEAIVVVHFGRGLVIIGGTSYAGEMKKSVFTILNHVLPLRQVLSMRCSPNLGQQENVALFFCLSGTEKITLSADPGRRLIGDDEHGWSDGGVFNFEGGCYAKRIRLSRGDGPQIWSAIPFRAVLENVTINPKTRLPDFRDDSLTRILGPHTQWRSSPTPSSPGSRDIPAASSS